MPTSASTCKAWEEVLATGSPFTSSVSLFISALWGALCRPSAVCHCGVSVAQKRERGPGPAVRVNPTRSKEGCRVVRRDQQAPGGPPLILKLDRCLCAVRVRFRVVFFLLSFINVNVIQWSICQQHGFWPSGALGFSSSPFIVEGGFLWIASCWVSCQPCQGNV